MLFSQQDLDAAVQKESSAELAHETARQEEIRLTGLAYEIDGKGRALASHYAKVRLEALQAQASGAPDTVYAPLFKDAARIHQSKKHLDAQYSFLTTFAAGDAELDLRRKTIDLLVARRMVFQIRAERLRHQTEQAVGAAATDLIVVSFPNESQAARWLADAARLTGEINLLQNELATRTKVIDAMKSDAAPQLFNI